MSNASSPWPSRTVPGGPPSAEYAGPATMFSQVAMVAPDDDFDGAPLLRGEVTLEPGHGEVTAVRLSATAHGVFEAYVGGERAGDDVLSPGWSAYEWRLRYRVYDVTSLVRAAGPVVVIGLGLGNGWYRGNLGFIGSREVYGSQLAAIAELEIAYADGHTQIAGTNQTWRSGRSEVLANDLYNGQTIDARLRSAAWLRPGAALDGWSGVHAVELDRRRLTPYVGPAVRRQETLAPQRIWASPSGRTLVDFGQNVVGWIRLRARGAVGTTITVRHAEVLEHGELGTRPLRSAEATDRFILSGEDDEFEPTLTFHGFRYAEISGYPGDLVPDALEAVVVHSDLARIGEFACSDSRLNQLHANVVWSQRGNFLDVPTDCPQRDERLGWTGDLAVFAPTAAYLFDVRSFLDDWLADLAAEQAAADGRMPLVIPDPLKYDTPPEGVLKRETTAIWGDAAVWVPWARWQAYGDTEALAGHYPAMVAHVRRVRSLLSPTLLWDTGFQFGDWLDPTAPPESPLRAKADNGVVATASFVRTLGMVRDAALALGRDTEAGEYDVMLEQVRAAFNKHYVSANGIVTSDCPTVYALAIVFGLLDGDCRDRAGQRLADLAQQNGYRVATGFAGTPYILDALTSTGHVDVAYRLLTETGCPSWLYPVTMGATTIWERWDSILPDGSINPGRMNSFNHYALGAVADWMHRTVGGIAPLDPGYPRVLVAPQPGGGLTWARAELATPRGRIAVHWSTEDGYDVDIPDGVTAIVRLPGREDVVIGSGSHHYPF